MLALALMAAFTNRLEAGADIYCTYTPETATQPDGIVHNYGPFLYNSSPYPLYITAVELNARSSIGTSAIIALQFFNNTYRELAYFLGPITSDTHRFWPFESNYVKVNSGDAIGVYVANSTQGAPMSQSFTIWYSYQEP
jgi:hypothetical protein